MSKTLWIVLISLFVGLCIVAGTIFLILTFFGEAVPVSNHPIAAEGPSSNLSEVTDTIAPSDTTESITTTASSKTITTTAPTTTKTQPSKKQAIVGSYYSTKEDMFSKEYRPCLTCKADGTFELLENLASSMGTYYGTYEVNGDTLILTVTSKNFLGYAGDDVTTIRFTIGKNNQLTLNTELCMSFAGDVFSKE